MSKITKYDLAVLGVTAVFLLGIGTWCWHGRTMTQPWQVEVSRSGTETVQPVDSGGPGKLLEGERININTAPAAELQRLPGIGEKRALAIVAWREENGPFEQAGDLTRVPGIGEGILSQCREYITTEG